VPALTPQRFTRGDAAWPRSPCERFAEALPTITEAPGLEATVLAHLERVRPTVPVLLVVAIYRKLGVSSRSEAVSEARRLGILST